MQRPRPFYGFKQPDALSPENYNTDVNHIRQTEIFTGGKQQFFCLHRKIPVQQQLSSLHKDPALTGKNN